MSVLPRTSFDPAITAWRTSTRWPPNAPNGFPYLRVTIHDYLTTNIHYVLDHECLEGMKGFFPMAASLGVLPAYKLPGRSAGLTLAPDALVGPVTEAVPAPPRTETSLGPLPCDPFPAPFFRPVSE